MATPNIDKDTGAINFTPTKEEQNYFQLRRDIKSIKDELNKLSNDLDEIKKILYYLISK